MKKALLFAIAAISLFFMPACETEVDVNANWEEITIVYGLLSQHDTTHYFRINKAFLGGNALQIAKIEDSSSYRNQLEVKLEGYKQGNLMQTIPFDTASIYNKDTGIFYNPRMVVYKGTGVLDPGYQYKLHVLNKTSGKEVSASTSLIHNFGFIKPPSGGRVSFNRGFNTPIEWHSAINGKRYEPMVRFHYFEVPSGTYDTIAKHLDIVLTTTRADDINHSEQLTTTLGNDAFYATVANKLSADFQGQRLAGTVDFIITAAGIEYDTYMRVNGPSYSLVQDRPEYTNVDNGFGLMSSRYEVTLTKRLTTGAEDELIALDRGFVKNPGL